MSANEQPDAMSPLGKLHEALIAHRRAFLEGAVAEVYRREEEPQDDGTSFYIWFPMRDSFRELNNGIKRRNKEVAKKYRSDTYTAGTFAQYVLSGFGYEGMRWDRDRTCFDSFFPEDEHARTIETRWTIESREVADTLNQTAASASRLVGPALAKAREMAIGQDVGALGQRLRVALWGDHGQWVAARIRWTYLRDLDSVVRELHWLATAAGDGDSLTDLSWDPRGVLTLDARTGRVSLAGKELALRDTQPFWFFYALARRPGGWVPSDDLADDPKVGEPKQSKCNLCRRLGSHPPWRQVVEAIKSKEGGYCLDWPPGRLQLFPPA